MKNILTKRAMTLFELLAVIVILGIIIAIGFPTVNRLISNSRKDAFAANVNSYISAAKTDALSDWAATGKGLTKTYYISSSDKPSTGNSEQVTFDITGLSAGAVEIVVSDDGSVTSVKIVKDFKSTQGNLTIKTNNENVLNKTFNRTDVK